MTRQSRRAVSLDIQRHTRKRRHVVGAVLTACVVLTGISLGIVSANASQSQNAKKPIIRVVSMFGDSPPKAQTSTSTTALELGTRFTPRTNGVVLGVRFYKARANRGVHVGTLWSANGQQLARVRFNDETATGWQTALFSVPVAVKSNTTYVVSYRDPRGRFSYETHFFNKNWTTPFLMAPSSKRKSGNSVFAVTSHGDFPTLSGAGANFFVDVDFVPQTDPPPSSSTTTSTTTTTDPPSTTTTTSPTGPHTTGSAPSSPPVVVCHNAGLLTGPATAPAGAVVVPAGDNSGALLANWNMVPNKTYWFAPGVHTLGTNEFSQIDPLDGDSFIGAPGAVIDGQGVNASAFDTQATNVTIQYLEIRNFNASHDQGVVNHDSGDGWTVENNYIHDNHGAALMTGSNNRVAYNCLDHNGQYGINAAGRSPSHVVIDHNEISRNDSDNVEAEIPGCGCTGGVKFWEVNGATVTDNYVHDNLSVGLWADTNDRAFDFEGNYISGNWGEGLLYELSYNAHIENNTFLNNAWGKGPTNPGFPTGAIYISESGGGSRVAGGGGAEVEKNGNVFTNNWAGVVMWENADRFCNSPNNSSTGVCTLVNPSVTLASCNAANIPNQPYYSDCRWKTQNISVHDNTFTSTPSKIPGCSFDTGCGYNGVFSNWGTSPSWSPYQGPKVEQAITFNQNNKFFNNHYFGAWHFMPMDQSHSLTFSQWQASPYSQDSNSTMTP